MRAGVLAVALALTVALAATAPAAPPVRIPKDYKGEIVRITVRTSGREKGEVYWGKKLLGTTPLVIERPRDSGPMDLVIRARGFLTLRTRAYTFSDDRLAVRLTRVAHKHTLFGYREPIPDAGVLDGGTPDAGVPDAGPPDPGTPNPGRQNPGTPPVAP